MSALAKPAAPRTARSAVAPADRTGAWAWIGQSTSVVTLLGAAVIHESVVEVHAQVWVAEGAFFVVLSMLEAFLAVALVSPRSRSFYGATIAVSLGTVAVWAVSRTVGVPVGPNPWQPEPVGRADTIATALEVATAVALLPLVASRLGARTALGAGARAALLAALATVVGVSTESAVRAGHVHPGAPGAPHAGHAAPAPARYLAGRRFVAMTASGPLEGRLAVAPGVVGVNTIDLIVEDAAGRRAEVDHVEIVARGPGATSPPLRLRAGRLAPGHSVVDVARLPAAGRWQLRVEARTPDGSWLSAPVTVRIRR